MSIRFIVNCPACGAEVHLTPDDIELVVPKGRIDAGPTVYRFVHFDDEYTHRVEAIGPGRLRGILEAAGAAKVFDAFTEAELLIDLEALNATDTPQAELEEAQE